MQCCVKYRAILDHVITALVCIQLFCEFARPPSQLNEDFIIFILLLKHMPLFSKLFCVYLRQSNKYLNMLILNFTDPFLSWLRALVFAFKHICAMQHSFFVSHINIQRWAKREKNVHDFINDSWQS